jgi:hypothetical protein
LLVVCDLSNCVVSRSEVISVSVLGRRSASRLEKFYLANCTYMVSILYRFRKVVKQEGGGAEGYKSYIELTVLSLISVAALTIFVFAFRCEEAMKNRYTCALCIRRGEQLCAVAGFYSRCTEVNYL